MISERLAAVPEAARFEVADVDFVAVRTGGPGGQHRNKASTAVRATHRPTGLVVVADTDRQQSANRRQALELLRRQVERRGREIQQAATAAQWRTHDQLVRGNPTRIERPRPVSPTVHRMR